MIVRMVRNAVLLCRDFCMFALMFLLILTVYAVVLPLGFIDKVFNTDLQKRSVSFLSLLAG